MAKRLAIALTNLVRMSRTSHAGLSEYINPYNKLLWSKGECLVTSSRKFRADTGGSENQPPGGHDRL